MGENTHERCCYEIITRKQKKEDKQEDYENPELSDHPKRNLFLLGRQRSGLGVE